MEFFSSPILKKKPKLLVSLPYRSESGGLLNFETLKAVVSRDTEGDHHRVLLIFKSSFLEGLFQRRRSFKIWKRWNKATWRMELLGTAFLSLMVRDFKVFRHRERGMPLLIELQMGNYCRMTMEA